MALQFAGSLASGFGRNLIFDHITKPSVDAFFSYWKPADESLKKQVQAEQGEKRKRFRIADYQIRLPGISRRHFNVHPDQILVNTMKTYRGRLKVAQDASGVTWGSSGSPAWTAHTGPTVSMEIGRYFRFNLNSWNFPIASIPNHVDTANGEDASVGSTITDKPRGHEYWSNIYQFYRLEGQTITLTLVVGNPEDNALNDDAYMTVVSRRYVSAEDNPYILGHEDDLEAWPETTGITEDILTRQYEEKSGTAYHVPINRRRTDGGPPTKVVLRNTYSRKQFASSAAKVLETQTETGYATNTDLYTNFVRFLPTKAHDEAKSGKNQEPATYIVQQIGNLMRGYIRVNAPNSEAHETIIHWKIDVKSHVRLHAPVHEDSAET